MENGNNINIPIICNLTNYVLETISISLLTYVSYDMISGFQISVDSSNISSILSYFKGSQTKNSSFQLYKVKKYVNYISTVPIGIIINGLTY